MLWRLYVTKYMPVSVQADVSGVAVYHNHKDHGDAAMVNPQRFTAGREAIALCISEGMREVRRSKLDHEYNAQAIVAGHRDHDIDDAREEIYAACKAAKAKMNRVMQAPASGARALGTGFSRPSGAPRPRHKSRIPKMLADNAYLATGNGFIFTVPALIAAATSAAQALAGGALAAGGGMAAKAAIQAATGQKVTGSGRYIRSRKRARYVY